MAVEAIHHRQASGLVREGKPTDGALFNVLGTTLGPVIGWILLFAIPFYPGSNVLLATAIAFACCIGLNIVYALFAATMPRSGGDYVFISRTFSPSSDSPPTRASCSGWPSTSVPPAPTSASFHWRRCFASSATGPATTTCRPGATGSTRTGVA